MLKFVLKFAISNLNFHDYKKHPRSILTASQIISVIPALFNQENSQFKMPVFPPVIGISQLAAPALSTVIFTHGVNSWAALPALLEKGIDNTSISFWVSKYSEISGRLTVAALLGSIGFGIHAATHLPFESFSRFYYLLGSISSVGYLLFVPYFKYKMRKISEYNETINSESTDPRSDIRFGLKVHFVSSIFDIAGASFFWYGLYNAIHLR